MAKQKFIWGLPKTTYSSVFKFAYGLPNIYYDATEAVGPPVSPEIHITTEAYNNDTYINAQSYGSEVYIVTDA